MNVMITSVGRRVELVANFQESVARLIPGAKVYGSDANPDDSPASRFVAECFTTPLIRDPGYIDALIKLCVDHGVRVLVPTLDPELLLLAEARTRFGDAGVEVVISDVSVVQQCRDKKKTPELFAAFGIATPREQSPADGLAYPVFIKPRDGSSSKDIAVAHGSGDVPPNRLTDSRFIFQDYLDPGQFDEFTVDMYFDRASALTSLVPRLRQASRGGEISKGMTVRDGLYDALVDRFASWPGARGTITMQVFADAAREQIFGIEVNPRFGGGYPLSHQAGADYPTFVLTEYVLGERIAFFDGWKSGLRMLRYDQAVFFTDDSH